MDDEVQQVGPKNIAHDQYCCSIPLIGKPTVVQDVRLVWWPLHTFYDARLGFQLTPSVAVLVLKLGLTVVVDLPVHG